MARPNYAFQKRQRELAKKQKKEEKRLRRAEAALQQADESPADEAIDGSEATSASGDEPGTAPEE